MVKAARKLLINYWANSLVKAGSESGSVIRNYSSCISCCFCNIFFFPQARIFFVFKTNLFLLLYAQLKSENTEMHHNCQLRRQLCCHSFKLRQGPKILKFWIWAELFPNSFFLFFSQCSMRYQLFFCVAHEGTCQQLSIQKEQITERDSSYMNIYSFPLM